MRNTVRIENTDINLEELADNLRLSDIATLILFKAHREVPYNPNSAKRDKDWRAEAKRSSTWTANSVIEHVKENMTGFLVRVAFDGYWEVRDKNIDSVLELASLNGEPIKRKYLNFSDYVGEYLANAGFAEIEGDELDFYAQTIKSTPKLTQFLKPFLDSEGRCDFGRVNDSLTEEVIKELFPAKERATA